ncbi:PLEIOTROPIC DRUG RESISTANCE SUBFAMILY PROTEIN [Salix koriyanagi]|uniref:PLEIOTROPIC DRUG RESISTANCE SUBFAMILY PROTEIN n=1 Tax=Salix koriyanagi TaxID=2511006 RepID=A0A9Q0TSK8_9ROSI|nr:PLEIOTROPIC DRUG RESISTANCE SUBFAMILY PROTEIN [Salix koriyanagi]
MAGLSPSKKRTVNILQDVKGIVKPSRMSLLLGPPGSGKTTLLKALAGRLDNDIKDTSLITDNILKILKLDSCADTMVGDDMIRGISGGEKKRVTTVFRLPVFFKQRSSMLYPAWAFGLPICLFSIPVSLIESGIWVTLTYYSIGFAPAASRFFKQLLAFFSTYQMTLSLYRFIAVVGRKLLVANILGFLTMVTVIVLGGFIITKDDIELWMRWGYYLSPIMYGQNAISINEFLDNRWGNLTGSPHESTVGKSLLKERGFFTDEYWYWICVGVLLGLSLIFNFLFIAALEFLNAPADSKAMIADDDSEIVSTRKLPPSSEGSSSTSEIG